jgi:hypothetical protein
MFKSLWLPFGSPENRQLATTPQTQLHDFCMDVCSASLNLGDGLIDVAFEDDTFWSRNGTSNLEKDGIAVVKVGLRVEYPVKKVLSRVECETTFSQSAEGRFQAVNSCWPAHPGTHRFDSNIWTFGSQKQLSGGRKSGAYDMVKHTLYMCDESHLAAYLHSKYHGAVVLRCANDPLIVTTLLKAFETLPCPDLRTVQSLFAQVETSIQVAMKARDAGVTLRATCEEVDRWMETKNSIIPLEGMVEFSE